MKKDKHKLHVNNASANKKESKSYSSNNTLVESVSSKKQKVKSSFSKEEALELRPSPAEITTQIQPQTSLNSVSTALTKHDTLHHHGEKSTQIRVIARFRPLNLVEQELSNKDAGTLCVKFIDTKTCSISTSLIQKTDFTLDSIFNMTTTQEKFYKEVITETITDTLNGYNGTVFTYGQSGSGKTFSMFGADISNPDTRGIIPRAIEQIFDHIENETNNNLYEIKFSILEIYKENLYDLLNPSVKYTDLKIKEDPKKGIYVHNLTIISVEDREEVYALLEQAEENRSVAETRLNKQSSRSHIVFMLYIKQKLPDDTEKLGTLNLVDLAGSEKVSKTGAIGETLEEAKKINSSLSALGNVISSLTSNNSDYIPYRDSKLTRLLKDSLGGNFKTTLIVTCSPHSYNAEETLSTLNFAKRAKNVKNKVKVNIKRSAEELERIVAQLTEKIRVLTEENVRIRSGSLIKFDEKLSWSLQEEESSKRKCEQLENVIKAKDEEIMRLKDDIDSLNSEKDELEKKVKNLQKAIDLDKTIETLEKSVRSNLADVESVYSTYKFQIENLYYDENLKLKEKLKEKEDSTINDLNNLLNKDFNINFTAKMQNIYLNMHNLLENLKSAEGDQYLFKSYETTYKNAKLFLNDLTQDLIKKTDIFHSKDIKPLEISEKITVDRKKYIELKNSLVQISALSIYYEKLLYDLLGKFSIDLKNYEITQKFTSDNSLRISNLNKNFHDYLEILDEVKRMKYNQSITATVGTIDINTIGTKDNGKPEMTYRNKFLKNITRRNAQKINPFNLLLKNIIEKNINEEQLKTEESDQTPRFQEEQKEKEISDKQTNSKRTDTEPLSSERSNPQSNSKVTNNEMGSTLISNENNHLKIDPSTQKNVANKRLSFLTKLTRAKRIDTDLDDNVDIKGNKSFKEKIVEEPKTAKNLTNLIQGFSFVNRDVFNSSFNKNEDMSELKILRKEKQLTNQIISNLTRELTELQVKTTNFDKIIIDYQEQVKNIYKNEQDNLRSIYGMIKEFFSEEIYYSKNIIDELSSIIDEMIINHNSIKDMKSKKVLSNFYHNKKNSIVKNDTKMDITLDNITESFIKQPGTATKKLDYLYIDFKKDDKYNVIYGSGLNKVVPSKSPLMRNLIRSLNGDIGIEMYSPSDC